MNRLKAALQERRPQIGLWQSLANPITAEICARAGYDWLLFDGEHSPNTIQSLLAQLQAVSAYPIGAVARPPVGDPAIIKQYLDIGFRSLLIPMVESADQARHVVAATRFPPTGIRGVAAGSRAFGFGADAGRMPTAPEEICLILQIENRRGLDAIESIATIDGVDALFIGPSDLAAALGYLGNPGHPDVQAAITDALARIAKAGKPAGIFATQENAKTYLAAGVSLVSLGTDSGLLWRAAKSLRQSVE